MENLSPNIAPTIVSKDTVKNIGTQLKQFENRNFNEEIILITNY